MLSYCEFIANFDLKRSSILRLVLFESSNVYAFFPFRPFHLMETPFKRKNLLQGVPLFGRETLQLYHGQIHHLANSI